MPAVVSTVPQGVVSLWLSSTVIIAGGRIRVGVALPLAGTHGARCGRRNDKGGLAAPFLQGVLVAGQSVTLAGALRVVRRREFDAEACCVPRCRRDALAEPRLRRWRFASFRRDRRVEDARGASDEAAAASVPVVRARLRAASAGLSVPRARTSPAARRKARNMRVDPFRPS
jgi:hypothetical protein